MPIDSRTGINSARPWRLPGFANHERAGPAGADPPPYDARGRVKGEFVRASRDLGFGEVAAADPSRVGAADVSFTEGLVDMALDGIGLMGDGGHTVNETASLKTLPSQAKRIAVTLLRLSEGPRVTS